MDFSSEDCDFLTVICVKTPEIAAKIFINVGYEDTFSRCNLVCKSWNGFLSGKFFFEQFLENEFGLGTVQKFAGVSDLQKFHQFAQGSPWLGRIHSARPSFRLTAKLPEEVLRVEVYIPVNSVKEFVFALRRSYNLSALSKYHASVLEKREWNDTISVFLLINLNWLVNVPEILDILKIPVAISALPSDHYADCFPVTLLDEKLNILSESSHIHSSIVKHWTFLTEYPSGVRFIVLRWRRFPVNSWHMPSVGAIFPSLVRKLEDFQILFKASEYGDVQEAERVLKKEPRLLSCRGLLGKSALEVALEFNADNWELIKVFLDFGANLKLSETDTALSVVAEGGYFETVRYIVSCGGADKADLTGAFISLFGRRVIPEFYKDIAEFLLEKGADIDGSDSMIPLAGAVYSENIESIRFLLSEGANVNVKLPDVPPYRFVFSCPSFSTALIRAAIAGNCQIVKLLLDYGADVNAEDTQGLTALYYAEKRGREDIVKLLEERDRRKRLGLSYIA